MVGGLVLWQLGLYNKPSRRQPLRRLAAAPPGGHVPRLPRAQDGPALGAAVSIVALAGDIAMGSLLATMVVFTDIVYAAVIYGPARVSRAVLPVSVAFAVAVTCALLAVFRTPETLLLGRVQRGHHHRPAWTGVIIRDHRNAAAAERLRAEQTALLAEMDRVQAVTAERARMARELHDVVANHLSAIAIHSTAALSLGDGRPDKDGNGGGDGRRGAVPRGHPPALGVIRENSVQGLAEMRRLIGLLSDASSDADETPPTSPTLAGLDALLDRARAGAENTGLRFTLRDQREPGASLPAPVELAAYRVVQESVTNALKHSGGGTVTVNVDRSPEPRTADGPRAHQPPLGDQRG